VRRMSYGVSLTLSCTALLDHESPRLIRGFIIGQPALNSFIRQRFADGDA
jgi:hypothetical protein